MKKITTIIAAVVFAILVALAIWFLFMRSDGEVSVVSVINNILPFGNGGDDEFNQPDNGNGASTNPDSESVDEFAKPTEKLFRIVNTPIAGYTILTKNNQNIVRYVDRATGNIHDVSLPITASSTTLNKTRITNNTLPKIYEAYFRPDGNAVIVRSLLGDSDVIENLSLTINSPNGTSTSGFFEISSTPLRGNMGDIIVSNSGNTIFYTLKDVSSIVSSAFNGSSQKTLFSSAFNEWSLATFGNNLLITTKPSSSIEGFAYSLSIANGSLNKVLGPLNALSTKANNAGTRVAYSYREGNLPRLVTKNLQKNTVLEIRPATFAEKCLWSTVKIDSLICSIPLEGIGANEPDNWYRGSSHFSDFIWIFDTKENVAEVISKPETDIGAKIDSVDLKLSSKEDYLVFMNKTDLTLWALRLK